MGWEQRPGAGWVVPAGIGALTTLGAISLFIGASAVSLGDLLAGDEFASTIFWTSRVPRLVAVVLTGASMGVAGLIMQALTRNRFVAPSTAGTVESATLGLLAATVWAPAASVGVKMVIASAFALAGTAIFLALVQRIRLADTVTVPLLGIMLGAVMSGITTFFAFRYDLLQTLVTWINGDFSGTLRGRYELLWFVAATTLASFVFARRFTVAGLGRDVATNLGVDHGRTVALGFALVSITSGIVVVVVGVIPFLGLVVPNLVTMRLGDDLSRVVPITALGGALFLLIADIGSRTIRAPYELPVGTLVGVVGGALFIALLMGARRPSGGGA